MRSSMSVSPPGSRHQSLARRSMEHTHSPAGSVLLYHDSLHHERPQMAPPLLDWPEYAALLGEGGIPNALEGWSALAKAVHKLDLQKIQDHKEDIDNLLVFAGLFSAVMTAFIIESYKDLRQNPRDAAVYFLENIAIQSNGYSLNSNFINSTLLPRFQSLPLFHASPNAIRVNVLWFASLAITLATASYGLLVKQWLREYLADDYTSPQAQLRIRNFRNPKLHQWMVFDIGSLLPMLLQLSLALFLIGLCFFTAEQHQSVGHTTLPLVAGWGFFFVAATFLPAVSRGCPYKTSFVRYNESSEANNEGGDVQMLADLDSSQSDEILLRTMWTALQQTGLPPAELLLFIQKIIQNRIQNNGIHAKHNAVERSTVSLPSSTIPDLSRLPRRSITSIMLMAAELLGNELQKPLLSSLESSAWQPSWMDICIRILFSYRRQGTPIPDAVNDTFALILADPSLFASLLKALKHTSRGEPSSFSEVFETLRGALLAVRGDRMLHVMNVLARSYFCLGSDSGVTHSTHTIIDIVCSETRHPEFQPGDLSDVAGFLMQSLKIRLFKQQEYPRKTLHAMNHLAMILCLFHWSSSHKKPQNWTRESLIRLTCTLLSSRRSINLYCAIAAGSYYNESSRDESDPEAELVDRVKLVKRLAGELFVEAITTGSERADRVVILQKLKHLVEDQRVKQTPCDQDDSQYLLVDSLEITCLLLRALHDMHKRGDPFDDMRREIRGVLQAVAAGKENLQRSDSHRDVAKQCLEMITSMDTALKPCQDDQDEAKMKEWANGFQESKSCFPNDFINVLASFPPQDYDLNISNRTRRRSINHESGTTGHRRAHSTGDMIVPPSNVAIHPSQRLTAGSRRGSRGRSPGPVASSIHQLLTPKRLSLSALPIKESRSRET